MKFAIPFLYVYSVVIPLFVLLYPKGLLTYKVYKNCNDIEDIGLFAKIQCYVPFYNSVIIRRTINGTAPVMSAINTYIVGSIVLKILLRIAVPGYNLVQLMTTMFTLIAIGLLYITDLYINITLAKLFDRGMAVKVLSIFPPAGAILIAWGVDGYFMRNKHLLDGTFEGM